MRRVLARFFWQDPRDFGESGPYVAFWRWSPETQRRTYWIRFRGVERMDTDQGR